MLQFCAVRQSHRLNVFTKCDIYIVLWGYSFAFALLTVNYVSIKYTPSTGV